MGSRWDCITTHSLTPALRAQAGLGASDKQTLSLAGIMSHLVRPLPTLMRCVEVSQHLEERWLVALGRQPAPVVRAEGSQRKDSMQKRVVGSIVLLFVTLGWGERGVGAQVPAPRGELRIVDKNP